MADVEFVQVRQRAPLADVDVIDAVAGVDHEAKAVPLRGAKAKALELKGWDYPRHLAGRLFSVVVHGDAAGTENLRRILADWLTDIGMIAAGRRSQIDSYIGYLGTYAENHLDLDRDEGIQEDVRNAARALVAGVKLQRAGNLPQPDAGEKSSGPVRGHVRGP